MSFRLGALLCLTGMVACSHNSETAQDAHDVDQTVVASNDASLTPASREDSTVAPATTPSTASAEGAELRAPVVADTKGPSSKPAPAAPPVEAPKAADPVPPSTAPDNTKVNKRDTNSAALTPMDQKENETDLKITQQIRQAVMADGSLSFTAKNVKIITQNGKVTLRGPVNTSQERSAIEAAARKVAGTSQVDNQIEVKK